MFTQKIDAEEKAVNCHPDWGQRYPDALMRMASVGRVSVRRRVMLAGRKVTIITIAG